MFLTDFLCQVEKAVCQAVESKKIEVKGRERGLACMVTGRRQSPRNKLKSFVYLSWFPTGHPGRQPSWVFSVTEAKASSFLYKPAWSDFLSLATQRVLKYTLTQ